MHFSLVGLHLHGECRRFQDSDMVRSGVAESEVLLSRQECWGSRDAAEPITCNPREGAVPADDRPQKECKGPGCPSPMSAGSADPGAQCSDAQNMALLVEDVNCIRIPRLPAHVRKGPFESCTPGDAVLSLERRIVVELVVVFGIAAGSGFRGAPVVVG